MNRLIRKVHIYLGLLNFSMVLVWGIAGLDATFRDAPFRQRRKEIPVKFQSYVPPSRLTDKELADHIHRYLKPPLTAVGAIRHDSENNLQIDYYGLAGVYLVTVLERENRLRIETTYGMSLWEFIDELHAVTPSANSKQYLLVRLWMYYNEFGIFSVIGMALSGAYLGLTSRPGYRPARYTLAAGCGIFLLLYFLIR